MRILVLGGTNFIGWQIVNRLRERHEVVLLNRGTNPVWRGQLRELTADRNKPETVRAAIDSDFDAVVDVSGTRPEHIESTVPPLLERGVTRYVFISSGAVYDSSSTPVPFPESAQVSGDPVWGPYGKAKVECEKLLHGSAIDALTILRPPYVYGPGNNEQREQFLWARMLAGEPIFVPGGGTTPIQFCPVGYLALAVEEACTMRLKSATYNIGESRSYSFDEYIETLREAAGVDRVDVRHVRDRSIAARDYFPFRDYSLVLDTRALEQALDSPPVALRTGLVQAFAWFREHDRLRYEPTPRELELVRL